MPCGLQHDYRLKPDRLTKEQMI